MNTRTSAARYARALLDVVVQEANPEQVEEQLAAFAELLEQHPDLQKALTSPIIPAAGKRGIVDDLATRLQMVPQLAKLLGVVADRDDVAVLPDLVATYRERLLEHRQIVRAEVVTAEPLTPEKSAQLQQQLAAITGRTVTMTTRVDPALIGGAVARVGSTVYDGSMATQLERIRERLSTDR
ncbi:MAG: ATP synthase F1 subunit delta [Acidimicrobiia bacterium]|nr:ATP synthase F1 subunit delta [Acidimicrobiia bacterium]